jgi:hypothetical protein
MFSLLKPLKIKRKYNKDPRVVTPALALALSLTPCALGRR